MRPEIIVFDDVFVAANVCSGIEIEPAHRQNLHELILGAQGVALNAALQTHITRIEQHNSDLRTKQEAIPAVARGQLTVNAFCALSNDPHVDERIHAAERRVSAAQSADTIRERAGFRALALPGFDVDAINRLLGRSLPNLEAAAARRVRAHLGSIGPSGEAWVADGVPRIAGASEGHAHEVCPFCAQDLRTSALILHYQAYFSEAYEELKTAIREAETGINAAHGGDIPASFERSVRDATQSREFWKNFTDVPEVAIDTAAVSREWTAARESILAVLRDKANAPFETKVLSEEVLAEILAYEEHRANVSELSTAMQACNDAIELVKEQVAVANVETLRSDLEKLKAKKARYEPNIAALCDDYLTERASKMETETLRDRCRADLDNYRQNIFPAYQEAVNDYLRRFNAGFRLGSVASVNTRGGSSATYNVLINQHAVSLNSDDGPSFRSTLSAGDRNTLALAFFFASLDQEPDLLQKIVVIDDPMTSLDEHRSLTTVQEMRTLCGRVSQMIVLSHSKSFLCAIWEGADRVTRSAMRIVRDGEGSSFALWNVHDDCITEHDHRHALVTGYIRAGNPAMERAVATALRQILESIYPGCLPSRFPSGHNAWSVHKRMPSASWDTRGDYFSCRYE